jgi:hypothetical protein
MVFNKKNVLNITVQMPKKRTDHGGSGGSGRKAEHARKKAARKSLRPKKRHTVAQSSIKPGTHRSGGTVVGKSSIGKGGW